MCGFSGGGSSTPETLAHTHNQALANDGGDLSETLTDMNGVALYSLITDNSAAVAANTVNITTNAAAIAAIPETAFNTFTTATTWTPTLQTGEMELVVDASSMTGGSVSVFVDGVEVESLTTAISITRIYNPSVSISVQTLAGSGTILVGSFEFGSTQVPAGAIVSVNLGDSGTKMYLAGDSASDNQAIYQYTLSNAYTVSTSSYASLSFPDPISGDVRGMDWRDDGTTWIRASEDGAGGGVNKKFAQFNPSSDWDISTSGSIASSFDYRSWQSFAKDVIWGNSGNQVTSLDHVAVMHTYDLGTAYLISSASDTAKDEDLSSIDNDMRNHAWNSNGSKCYCLGNQNDKVYQLDCSTPWDITSMTHTASNDIDVSGETTNPYGLWISGGITPSNIYVGSSNSLYKVYQYGANNFAGTVSASQNE